MTVDFLSVNSANLSVDGGGSLFLPEKYAHFPSDFLPVNSAHFSVDGGG